MAMKRHVSYTYEADGQSFPIPFEFEESSAILRLSPDGQYAMLGVLVWDEDASDPMEASVEGLLYQFNRNLIYDCDRPDLGEFKRLIRENPGRIVPVDVYCDGIYKAERGVLDVADTKGEDCLAGRILEEMGGYYIPPDDVTDPLSYAKGFLETYSDWCKNEVYGVCVWEYRKDGTEWTLTDGEHEDWGYYGREAAEAELASLMAPEVDNAAEKQA